jgi:hypothetical protein
MSRADDLGAASVKARPEAMVRSGTRRTRWLMTIPMAALIAEAFLGAPSARAGGRVSRPDTLPVGEIRSGMKGYGLTVFEGTRPERFGVEVINVAKNYFPAQDLILVKVDHPRLDVVKSVNGMSGSPIFIHGKMVGAYAYGWPFGSEPVAGVTPIGNMVADMDRPSPKEIFGWPIAPTPLSRRRGNRSSAAVDNRESVNRYVGRPSEYTLQRHVEQLAANRPASHVGNGAQRPLATPVLLGGLGSVALNIAQDLFAPLGLKPMQAGGGGSGVEPGAPEHFENGGALGIQLIRGDINAMPLGTVTRVEGDRLVAFGHTMMNAGVTSLPTAVARVLWIWASDEASFKFAVPARPLGALVSDGQASVVASESGKAPVIPVTLQVDGAMGAPKNEWHVELAQEPFMTPSLLAVALGNALQATAAERQDVTWRAESQVKVRGYGDVTIQDFGVAVGGTPDARHVAQWGVVAAVGGILNNPWKHARVESVQTRLTLEYAREVVRLRGARVVAPEVEAGRPIQLLLSLVPFAGPPFIREVTIPIPPSLAGKKVTLSIRPGHQVEREKPEPENLDDFIRNLEDPIYPPKSIVVSYSSGAGVAFKGRVAEHLPAGALDAIQQRTSTFAPQAFRSEQRHVIEIPQLMVGSETVTIQVRPVLR